MVQMHGVILVMWLHGSSSTSLFWGLTHWGRATHICVGKLTTIGSNNGLSPGRRQAIIWTIAGIVLIGPVGTNFSEILIGIQAFSFKKRHLKMSSAKWRPSCLGLNVLRIICILVVFILFQKIRHTWNIMNMMYCSTIWQKFPAMVKFCYVVIIIQGPR